MKDDPTQENPSPNLTIEAKGRVVEWRPKQTETGPVCRIIFETPGVTAEDLDLLWTAIGARKF